MWVVNVCAGVSVLNDALVVIFSPLGATPVAVTVYACATFRFPSLCQLAPPPLRLPVTGSPEVLTVTLVTLPLTAVTVMPAEGSTSLPPVAGVIFRSLASAAAWAEADAAAWARDWLGETAGVLWPPLHAEASRPMTAVAATAAILLAGLRSVPRTVTLLLAPVCLSGTQFTYGVLTDIPSSAPRMYRRTGSLSGLYRFRHGADGTPAAGTAAPPSRARAR